MTQLRDAVGDAAFIFVAGKGGTGKTTAAGALALELADAGIDTHLISTDPAHSLGDLFETDIGGDVISSDCAANLAIEEFDASAYAEQWLGRSLAHVIEIVEAGTYLDGDDVAAFGRLALPGLDEMMAVLRLADLAAAGRRVVVDTAPTGHTLRLLDAAATHEGIAYALGTMADKAAAVAGSFAGRSVRLTGEQVIDDLNRYVDTFRTRVLGGAAFVIAARDEPVVAAETARLRAELDRRALRTVATVVAQQPGRAAPAGQPLSPDAGGGTCLRVPQLERATGCAALRIWRDALTACGRPAAGTSVPAAAPGHTPVSRLEGRSAGSWLSEHAPRLLLFAGKGGVGKSTCAAAAALTLAESRPVLLCSTDPAGSLDDVFGRPITQDDNDDAHHGAGPRLRARQIDPGAELAALREAYRADALDALRGLGLTDAAELDRRVIEALWEMAPPGIDEVAGLTAMLDIAETGETVVFDTAPTGHFLRLLNMPELALEWTRQLMRVVVKYGLAGSGGGAAEALLRLSRELRSLQRLLREEGSAGVIVVTLRDPMVTAETERLERALHDAGVDVLARLTNRAGDIGPTGATGDRIHIAAPAVEQPIGEHALREFAGAWKIVG